MKSNQVLENSLSLLNEIKAQLNHAKTITNKSSFSNPVQPSPKKVTTREVYQPKQTIVIQKENAISFGNTEDFTTFKAQKDIKETYTDVRTSVKEDKSQTALLADEILNDMRKFSQDFETKCHNLEEKIQNVLENMEDFEE